MVDVGGLVDVDDDRLIDVVGLVVGALFVLFLAVIVLAFVTAPARKPSAPPDANWTIHRVDAEHVEIVHASGPPVNATKLLVSVGGIEHGPGRRDTLTNGEGITVSASPGERVQLLWIAQQDDHVPIQTWQAP